MKAIFSKAQIINEREKQNNKPKLETDQCNSGGLYQSFTSPEALAVWLAPGEMTGKVHNFDLRVTEDIKCRCSIHHPKKNNEARPHCWRKSSSRGMCAGRTCVT